VIIVAVTIAVAIAVAFWMTGIIALFTGAVEKLEVVSATATALQGGGGWQITVIARNTGTTQTTIDMIFINGIQAFQWQNNAFVAGQLQCQAQGNVQLAAQIAQGNNPLSPGDQVQIQITLPQGNCGSFNALPGVSLEVKLHTTGGKEYPKLLTLP
jgi:hypothetical protein